MRFFGIVLALLALSGCPTPPAPPSPAPHNDGETCFTACGHMDNLGCPLNSPSGGKCIDICENARRNAIAFPVSCLANSATCDSALRCR